MAAFAQSASDLDPATQRLLARGERLTELLKQPQYSPLTVAEQVVVIFAGTQGFADKIAVGDITTYESRLLDAVRDKGADILATITEEKALSDDTSEKLKKFLDDFTKSFAA